MYRSRTFTHGGQTKARYRPKPCECPANEPLAARLEELMLEAQSNHKEKQVLCFSNALRSLRNVPRPLRTVKEVKAVNGIGDFTLKKLKSVLAGLREDDTETESGPETGRRSAAPARPRGAKRPRKDFRPAPGTSAWLFLVALHKSGGQPRAVAQVEEDAEMLGVRFELREGYFASAMERVAAELKSRGLVDITGKGPRRKLCLSSEGRRTAQELHAAYCGGRSDNSELAGTGLASASQMNPDDARVGATAGALAGAKTGTKAAAKSSPTKDIKKRAAAAMPVARAPSLDRAAAATRPPTKRRKAAASASVAAPAARETALVYRDLHVVLVQDTRENEKNSVQSHLLQLGIACENRSLSLGDMLWIARDPYSNREFVLDFVVERKSVPDLAASIIDGRYEEQKARLRASGLGHVTYLVEGAVGSQERLPAQNLRTALAETQLTPQFRVRRTDNIAQSAEELRRLHEQIRALMKRGGPDARALFADGDGGGLWPLRDFQRESRKSRATVAGHVFGKMLCQVPGLSHTTAAGILAQFPTLRQAVEEADGLGEEGCVAVYKQVRGPGQARQASGKSLRILAKLLTQLDYREG